MGILFLRRIHIHAEYSCLWESCLHHVLDLLGSCAEFSDITGTAFRTLRHLRLFITTVMADHFSTFVYRQGYITVRAFHYMATFSAGNKTRISSAIQKQHNLLFCIQSVFNQFLQLLTQDGTVSILQFLSHINCMHSRHLLHMRTILHLVKLILTKPCPIHCLHRRSCTSEHNACIFYFCPVDCYFSCMITWHLLTLVGWFMLFVNNDQTQIRKWSKKCRAWSDHHIDLALLRTHHLIVTFSGRQS